MACPETACSWVWYFSMAWRCVLRASGPSLHLQPQAKQGLHIFAVYCVPAHLAHGPVTTWLPRLGPIAREPPHSRLLRHVSERRACISTITSSLCTLNLVVMPSACPATDCPARGKQAALQRSAVTVMDPSLEPTATVLCLQPKATAVI